MTQANPSSYPNERRGNRAVSRSVVGDRLSGTGFGPTHQAAKECQHFDTSCGNALHDSHESVDCILNCRTVCNLTNLSRSTIWRKEREQTFPARVRLSKNRVGWRESEIQNWIASCSLSAGGAR